VSFFKKEKMIPLTEEEKAIVIARYEKKMMSLITVKALKLNWKVALELWNIKRKAEHNFKDLR